MATQELKERQRSDYLYFLDYRTRWSVYTIIITFLRRFSSCVPGAIMTNIRTLIIQFTTTSSTPLSTHISSKNVAKIPLGQSSLAWWFLPIAKCVCLLVLLSSMKLTKPSVQFFSPLSFPEVLELGLRVNKLGSSSAVYEVGIFKSGEEVPAAVGGYTHVFVQRNSRKSTQMLEGTRLGLAKLLNTAAKL